MRHPAQFSVCAVRLSLCAIVALAAGCAAIDENHYFASYVENPTADNPTGLVNIFRVTVDGNAGLSNVRYIAGEYDERAVDFFLNEVKAQNYKPSGGKGYGPDRIFRLTCDTNGGDDDAAGDDDAQNGDGDSNGDSTRAPGTVTCTTDESGQIRLASLSDNEGRKDNDAFVIIMSTNANAISETIGAFAENTVVIQSLNYLLHKDTFQAEQVLDATESLVARERAAVLQLLTDGFRDLSARNTPGIEYELAMLQSIAVAMDPESPVMFSNLQEARAWFGAID